MGEDEVLALSKIWGECIKKSEGEPFGTALVYFAKAVKEPLEVRLAESTEHIQGLHESYGNIAREYRERAEQAEQRNAESRGQEPYGYNGEMPIYTAPIVPPDVEEAVKAERERLSWDGYLSSTCTSRPNGPSTIHLHFNGANKAEIAYIKLISVVEEAIRARGKT